MSRWPSLTLAQRFSAKIRHDADCWEWLAARNAAGYGVFGAAGHSVLAHRFMWTLANGPIPNGLFVLHRCDNPGCVRPTHLWLGTREENNADRDKKGRTGRHHNGTRKITAEQAWKVRTLARAGRPYAEIAAAFGISTYHVGRIASGRRWHRLNESAAPTVPLGIGVEDRTGLVPARIPMKAVCVRAADS